MEFHITQLSSCMALVLTLLVGQTRVDAAVVDPFQEIMTVGSTSRHVGYLLAREGDGNHFLVVLVRGVMRNDVSPHALEPYYVVDAIAEKGIVQDWMIGRRVHFEALVLKKEFLERENRITVFLRIESVSPGFSPSPREDAAAEGQVDLRPFQGITLVANRNMDNVNRYRTLGMHRGFGQGQPVSDFKANKKFVNDFGKFIEKGERFVIGKVEIVPDNLDQGAKLLLVSGTPKAGLHFYCYGYDGKERRSWPIDFDAFEKAVAGYFKIERPKPASPDDAKQKAPGS